MCHAPGCDSSAGALFVGSTEVSRAWRKTPQRASLIAPNDLPDPRVIQADQLANLAKGQPVLLCLRERFAPSLPRSLAVALKPALSSFDRSSGGLALGVVRHRSERKGCHHGWHGSR